MAASRWWKRVAIYSQIRAKFVTAVNVSGMISIGLAPLPNTSCTAAATISLKGVSGIITEIFTSIEKQRLDKNL